MALAFFFHFYSSSSTSFPSYSNFYSSFYISTVLLPPSRRIIQAEWCLRKGNEWEVNFVLKSHLATEEIRLIQFVVLFSNNFWCFRIYHVYISAALTSFVISFGSFFVFFYFSFNFCVFLYFYIFSFNFFIFHLFSVLFLNF